MPSQIWVKLHLGDQRSSQQEIALDEGSFKGVDEGSPIKIVQLGFKRTQGLDIRDPSNPKRVLEASKVYWRTRQTDMWHWLGFYRVLPLYDIPIGGEPPNGKWANWNGAYYVASSGILVRQK